MSTRTDQVHQAVMEIQLEVSGYPPAKGEALSMFGARHSHAPRVRLLLEAARSKAEQEQFGGFGVSPLGLELLLRCPRDRNRGDATNYLGGIGDVLEGKAHRGQLEHLGDLAQVALYDNDRQIEEVRYHWEEAANASYAVCLWSIDG